MSTYTNRGKHVFPDPLPPGDSGPVPDAAMIIPPKIGEQINGAPVESLSHQFVIKKNNASN